MSWTDSVQEWSGRNSSPIAFITKSEPGWRVVQIRYNPVPGQAFYVEGEYKMVILPIRFWGHRIRHSETYRGKVDNSYESIVSELNGGFRSSAMLNMRDSNAIDSHPHPQPLGKGKKPFSGGIIEILDPSETDQSAINRIEAHLEHERQILNFSRIRELMDS